MTIPLLLSVVPLDLVIEAQVSYAV
jgi:hypothetical protein